MYVCTCKYTHRYIYIYIWRKIQNENNPKVKNLLRSKVDVKRFVFNEPSSGL